ncbi:MAG TPA: hypothetical protein VKS03_10680 [Thermoanaerobaculia bacterium]|nr:hypothetical protein [Thermoanaerobaculia bacterium]
MQKLTGEAMQELSGEPGRNLVNAIALGKLGDRKRRGPAPPWVESLHEKNASWWKQPNVIGLAVGRKVTAGREGPLSLVVFVKRKLTPERVRAERLIPRVLDASPMGVREPIPVDVQKVGQGRAEALISANRPAQPGFSVGNRVGGSGTIGCVVRDRATSNQFGLTCAHVLAPVPSASTGDRVLVPALVEARASHVLGRAPMGSLQQIVPPVFSDSALADNVDVATFSPTNPATLDPRIAIVGSRPSGVASTVSIGTPVRKVGASSELTTGEVKFIHMIFWLAYPTPTGEEVTAGFEDLIGVTHFSNFGDSGSLVITEDGKAVGLVLGSTPEFTACLPIERALDALNCDLVVG